MRPTLHIIEPALVNAAGHFPSLVRAMIAAAAANFGEIRVHAHHRVDVTLPGASIAPLFRRRIRRFQVAWLCRRVLATPCTILFSTAHPSDFMGVDWALRLVRRPLARVVFFVHMHYDTDKRIGKMREIARRRPDLVIAAPTPGCAAAIRSFGFTNVHEAPYPHIDEHFDAGKLDAPAHLLMPGVPRIDKGLPAIADYAEHLAAAKETIPLVVQVSTDHWGQTDEPRRRAVQRLRDSGYTPLRLIENQPDAAEYAAHFRGAIVLQPYDRVLFAERISGVTLDALRAGCPVLVTDGTWMSRQVLRHGAGVALADHTPQTLHAAVRTVLSDLARFRAGARAAGDEIRREQSSSRLSALLTGEPAAVA